MCILLLHLPYMECYIKENQERIDNFTSLWHIRVSISCRRARERKGERNRERAFCFDIHRPEYRSIVCFSETRSHGCGLSDSECDVRWRAELIHISSNCSTLPDLGTHVEHGKRRLFLGWNGGMLWFGIQREKEAQGVRRRAGRGGGGGEGLEEESALLFLIDYSEGQKGDGLVCTTLWHNNVLR